MKKISLLFLCFIFVNMTLVFNANCSVDDLKALFEKATEEYSNQNYPQAIKLYEKAIEIYPNFAPAYNFLGLCYKDSGSEIDQVIWYFKKAIELDPKYIMAYDNLGKVYYGIGDFAQAEKYCLTAIEKDPQLISSRLTLGWIYLLGMSRPRDAIVQFKEALGIDKAAYAYFGLGMAYFMDQQSGRTLEMITNLREMKREDLASQLEQMVRNGRYIPTQASGSSLILKDKAPSVIDSNGKIDVNNAAENIQDLKVRLRGPLPE